MIAIGRVLDVAVGEPSLARTGARRRLRVSAIDCISTWNSLSEFKFSEPPRRTDLWRVLGAHAIAAPIS